MKRLLIAMVLIFGVFCNSKTSEALTSSMKDTADQIADICIEEWEHYGILPSIAVGQAFVESTLGDGPNLFGVRGHSGRGVVSATYGYLQTLHNGYFHNVAFHRDREVQMSYILSNGNYCEGEYPYGRYFYNVINSIYNYGWDRYDQELEKKLAEKDRKRAVRKRTRLRKKRQRGTFRVVFSDDVESGTCVVDNGYIKKGSVVIFGFGHFEATKYKKIGNAIILPKEEFCIPSYQIDYDIFDMKNKEFTLQEVIENVKG